MWVCLQRIGECFYHLFVDESDYEPYPDEQEDEVVLASGEPVSPRAGLTDG